MKARILVALVGIPFLLVVLIWAPVWTAYSLVSIMCIIGAREFMDAVAGEKGKGLRFPTQLAAALVPTCLYLRINDRDAPLLELLGFGFLLLLFVLLIFRYGKEGAVPFAGLSAALFAGIVFPLMLSCLLLLRLMDNGMAWVFVPLCIAFGSDTFAFAAGMLCGRHKLAPHVSPKKTVEGAFGGLAGGVIGMLLFKWVAEPLMGISFGYEAVVLFGLVGSVISQLGDLSFSVIKREFGVKDYGTLLPGHGGILDRFDSVTFVAPVVWILLSFA